jgi:hypothetical protein
MRSAEEYNAVVDLVRTGFNDCDIARRTGIPRTTVRGWRREGAGIMRNRLPPAGACPRCGAMHDLSSLPGEQYAYLLGLYLGDGYICRHPRDVYRLRIYLDRRYGEIIEAAAFAMSTVMPNHRVGRLHKGRLDGGCIEVSMYSKQWPCLFPQHGVGRKHSRRIALTAWQQAIVDENHQNLLCGLIDSDGCRFIARQRQRGTLYEWTRYSFCNLSRDIRQLFCASCDALGVEWTQSCPRTIQVAKRASVARLESFIGPKA